MSACSPISGFVDGPDGSIWLHESVSIPYASGICLVESTPPVRVLVRDGVLMCGADPGVLLHAQQRADQLTETRRSIRIYGATESKRRRSMHRTRLLPKCAQVGDRGRREDVTPDVCRKLLACGGPGGAPLSAREVAEKLRVSRRTVMYRLAANSH